MKNKKITILITVFIVVVLGAIIGFNLYSNYFKNKPEPIVNNESNDIVLPETIFDVEEGISNTNIAFGYPSKGFYGVGIEISEIPEILISDNFLGGFVLRPIQDVSQQYRGQDMTVYISITNNLKELTLSDMVENIPAESINGIYAKSNGKVIKIGNQEFFVYRISEDVTDWIAFTIFEDKILSTHIAYKRSHTPESDAVNESNEKLFIEFLENIKFE